MSTMVELQASDGHRLGAYVAEEGEPQAGLVIIQEIFGVNSHIRSVADGFARDGYCAIAPALFDRAEKDLQLAYVPEDTNRGRDIAQQIGIDNMLLDVAAALEYAAQRFGPQKVGVVGYCLGGTLAWLAATRHSPAAAVGYYGGRISQYASEQPRCPVMLHFGANDPHIPSSEITIVRNAHPDLPIYLYDAGHGFNCDQRKDYAPVAARIARERTLGFLAHHVARTSRAA
ncbi:MAG TPA: dienelactone hydrolase family protein [Terriglobales bacterium]|jgi:carboxymethylenebutenolidase